MTKPVTASLETPRLQLDVPKRIHPKSPPSPKIREATGEDIHALVSIHSDALPDDFLARLGRRFLAKVFFPTLLASPRCRVFVADEKGNVLGLIVTRVGMGGILTQMFTHRPSWFVLTCLCAVVRRPALLIHAVSVICQLRSRRSRDDDNAMAELFLMAVDRRARRCGVGQALIEHSADRLRASGIDVYRVLLHADNELAQAIYESTGFIETRIHRFAGHLWSERDRNLQTSRRPRNTAHGPAQAG